MKLDDAGRRAASVLEHEVRQQLDAARSLRQLHETVERPARQRTRAKPLLVAFVSVIVVAAIAVLVGETRPSEKPSATVPEHIYAYLPDALPPGMHAIGGGLEQSPLLPPGDPHAIEYGAYFGARPTLSVTTWTQGPPYKNGTATTIRGHYAQLFTTRDGFGVPSYRLWWQERSYTIEVDAVGLPLSQVRRFAESLRPVDHEQFRAAARGIASPPTAGLQPQGIPADSPSGPNKTLATYPDTTNGSYTLSLGTFNNQGRKWLCASANHHGNNDENRQPECVDSTGGFPFPSYIGGFPNSPTYLIGSLPRTVRSVIITLDTGQTLPATLHNTGTGHHPIFTYVNLGMQSGKTISGTITVTDKNGKTIKLQHFKFGLRT